MAGRWSVVQVRLSRPLRRRAEAGHDARRDARRCGADAGVDAAVPLRRRLPSSARARVERRHLARAAPRLSDARGARRDQRRPLRLRHVGRAVRAARRRGPAARGSTLRSRRRVRDDHRRGSAQSHRHHHARRPHSRRGRKSHRLPQRRAARRHGRGHASHARGRGRRMSPAMRRRLPPAAACRCRADTSDDFTPRGSQLPHLFNTVHTIAPAVAPRRWPCDVLVDELWQRRHAWPTRSRADGATASRSIRATASRRANRRCGRGCGRSCGRGGRGSS